MRMEHWVVLSTADNATVRDMLTDDFRSKFDDLGDATTAGVIHHIDDCAAFSDETKYPRSCHPRAPIFAEKLPEAEWSCEHGHKYDVCLCHLPVIHWGQDECVFHAYLKSRAGWSVNSTVSMRSKSDGPGVMVSAYQCEKLGLGAGTLTAADLVKFNEWRRHPDRHGDAAADLLCWPSEVFFAYGKAHGYWGSEHTAQQAADMIDLHLYLYPGYQMLGEFDHSGTHLKKADDALTTSKMGMRFGGKQAHLHDSQLTAGCVGDGAAFLWHDDDRTTWSLTAVDGWTCIDCRLYAGDTQHFDFDLLSDARPPPPPPWYMLDAPLCDKAGVTKKGKPVTVPGYAGAPKGKKQVLWERGLWVDKMTDKGKEDVIAASLLEEQHEEEELEEFTDPDAHAHGVPELPDLYGGDIDAATRIKNAQALFSAYKTLLVCEDFYNEPTVLEEIFNSRGMILLLSPKAHPELAGVGIEFSWGMAKKFFRRRNCQAKRLSGKTLNPRVLLALRHVTKANVAAFARRTRRYRAAYEAVANSTTLVVEYVAVEKFVKLHKTHRCIMDQETAFLQEQEALAGWEEQGGADDV